MNEPLARMFHYNRWANLRLFEACRALPEDTLDAHPPGVSGSVRTLLLHIAGAQQTFVLRTAGRQHEGELNRESDWPGWDAVMRVIHETSDALIRIAEELEVDRDVTLPWMGSRYSFPAGFFLVHALEHGVEHRTEIKVALNQVGIRTPDLDAWAWAPEAGYGLEVERDAGV